jgi:hypothetical protein
MSPRASGLSFVRSVETDASDASFSIRNARSGIMRRTDRLVQILIPHIVYRATRPSHDDSAEPKETDVR